MGRDDTFGVNGFSFTQLIQGYFILHLLVLCYRGRYTLLRISKTTITTPKIVYLSMFSGNLNKSSTYDSLK
jgi:hypothetical protein